MRAKLFAAFQRFGYQRNELDFTSGSNLLEVKSQAAMFARRIVNYDIWQHADLWPLLEGRGAAIQRLIDTGSPSIMSWIRPRESFSSEDRLALEIGEILTLWQQLDTLSKTYEDMYREAYLPTALGLLLLSSVGAMLGSLNISLQASVARR